LHSSTQYIFRRKKRLNQYVSEVEKKSTTILHRRSTTTIDRSFYCKFVRSRRKSNYYDHPVAAAVDNSTTMMFQCNIYGVLLIMSVRSTSSWFPRYFFSTAVVRGRRAIFYTYFDRFATTLTSPVKYGHNKQLRATESPLLIRKYASICNVFMLDGFHAQYVCVCVCITYLYTLCTTIKSRKYLAYNTSYMKYGLYSKSFLFRDGRGCTHNETHSLYYNNTMDEILIRFRCRYSAAARRLPKKFVCITYIYIILYLYCVCVCVFQFFFSEMNNSARY